MSRRGFPARFCLTNLSWMQDKKEAQMCLDWVGAPTKDFSDQEFIAGPNWHRRSTLWGRMGIIALPDGSPRCVVDKALGQVSLGR